STGGGTTGGGSTGGGTTGGSTTGGAGTDTAGSGTSAPTTTTQTTPAPSLADANAATDQERVLARAAADAAAKSKDDLDGAAVPAAAYDLGSGRTSLPVPLLVTLVACAAAACIAGGATGFQALRRRRGR
ncbi:hypothetical protein ACVU7I_14330, partial [Patulibacter sp. S7RM1-6]